MSVSSQIKKFRYEICIIWCLKIKNPRFGRVNPIITCTEGQVGCLSSAVSASNFCEQVQQEACTQQMKYSIP